MIVIPMAGLSRRFRDAGYDRPKYMLELHGRTLFAHAVQSFRAYFATEPFLFIARDVDGTADFIEAQTRALGVRRAERVMLSAPTAGQADTVRLGLEAAGVGRDSPITVFNIDTFRRGFRRPDTPWMATADGYIEVMRGSDPGFSYVLPSGAGDERVARTAEKVVISDLASTGLYHFRQAGAFLDACAADGVRARDGELYVAPLYNLLIEAALDVRYHLVPETAVTFCGTPLEYEALLLDPAIGGHVP